MALLYGTDSRGMYAASDKGRGDGYGGPSSDLLREADELMRAVDGYGLDLEGLQGSLEETLGQGNAALLGVEGAQATALEHLRFLKDAKDDGHRLARRGLYVIPGGRK